MKENLLKVFFTAVGAALTVYFKAMAIPIVILVLVMVADYITGMIKAWVAKEINSRIGVLGIIKKLCYLIVVCCGIGIDWIIKSALEQAGITFTASFAVGLIVIIWLVINEIISILENLSVIGVPMPQFLTNIVKKLKITVENKGNSATENTVTKFKEDK